VVTVYKQAEGVIDVAPDVKSATVTITYNAAKTDPDKLIKAMTDPKYTVSKQPEKKKL